MSAASSIVAIDRIAPRQCLKCTVIYPGLEAHAMFRANADSRRGQMHLAAQPRHVTCIACELTTRTQEKIRDRWRSKANDTISRHAKRLGITRHRLITEFGWHPDLIAHDLEHAYSNSCCYCDGGYAEMPNGLADLTIDVIDPGAPPYYRTNAQPCCATCNREKHQTPPHLWAAKLAGWDRWKRAHLAWPEGSLFA